VSCRGCWTALTRPNPRHPGPASPPRRVPGHRPWAVADQGDAVALARGAQATAQRLPALGGPGLPRVPEFVRALAPHGVQPLRIDRYVLESAHALPLVPGRPLSCPDPARVASAQDCQAGGGC